MSRATNRPALTLVAACLVALAVGGGLSFGQDEPLIAEVRVEGAGWVSADAVLDAVKDILKPGDAFSQDNAEAAKQAVLKMGYYEQVTVSQRVVPDGIQVVITVVEKKRIEKVLFVGNTVLTDQDLLAAIKSQPGRLVDPRLAGRDAERIQETYTKAGYFCQVGPPEVDNFGVLTFVIDEARIEEIKVSGLKDTKEWVVRRQINMKVGELFQERRVQENRRRILDLQIFKECEPDVMAGKLDPARGVIVEFKITEGKTGQAQFALAYSNLDRLVLALSLQENNFRGQAERAAINVELFGRTSYDLTYTEPFWDEKDTSLEVSLFDTERKRRFVGGVAVTTSDDRFDERRSGGSIRFSRPLDAQKRKRGSIQFRSEEVSSSSYQGIRTLSGESGGGVQSAAAADWWRGGANKPVDNPGLYPDVPEPGDIIGPVVVAAPLHPGGRLTSLTVGYSSDLRDSRMNPGTGTYTSLNAEVAGTFLGGQADFRKLQAEHRRYYPVRGGKDTLAVRLMGGLGLGDMPLFESFSVGGANSLRGYTEDRFRGEKMLLATAEYRHPISDSLTMVGFLDVGDAFGGLFQTVIPGFFLQAEDQSLEAHVGMGVGMRVQTPLGPIRLDFGWGDDGNQAHFSFGQAF